MKKTTLAKTCLAILILPLIGGGCSTNQHQPPKVGNELSWSTHQNRPDWVVKQPKKTEDLYRFVGVSYRHATERSAREAAIANAATHLIRHASQLVNKEYELKSSGKAKESRVLNSRVLMNDIDQVEAIGIIQNMGLTDIYIEYWKSDSSTFFKAFALVEINKEDFYRINEEND